MKRVLFAAVLSAALASVWTAPIAAQVTTGTIVGTVTDPNGVVPGATVVIHEVNRGTSDTVVTDGTGSYTAPFLTPGTYRIEINVSGFKKWVRDGVILQVNQTRPRRRDARGWAARGDDDRRGVGAAASNGLVGGGDGHRGTRD